MVEVEISKIKDGNLDCCLSINSPNTSVMIEDWFTYAIIALKKRYGNQNTTET